MPEPQPRPVVMPVPENDSEESFRLLVESVRDYAIFRLDPGGHVATWNLGARRIKGYEGPDIIGRHFSIFYPREDVEAGKCEYELEVAAREGRFEDEGWRLRKDGSRFWANVVITALRDKEGRLRGFAKVTRDMTERRHGEEILRQAKEEAEQANRAKTEFLSRISHELRTPLTAILGFAELLEMEGVAKEQEGHVAAILRAADHLLQLIDEVLDISRIEEGREDLRIEPVRVDLLVQEVVDLMLATASQRRITVRSEMAAGTRALADPQRLKQVLLNLVSNAVKYNRDEGSVVIRVLEQTDTVRIEVADSGLGIPSDKLGRLFQPFDRLGAEETAVAGTGLGLTVSKRIVEALGGSIGLLPADGGGSVFWVELPLADESVAAPELDEPIAPPGPAVTGRSATVLHIEDNADNRSVVEHALRRRPKIRLISSTLGVPGIALAFEHLPDLILLDVHLPDMDGGRVLERLKSDPRTASIPVVVLTADATDARRQSMLQAGATGYLTKPLRLNLLLQTVDALLARRAAEA